MSPPSPPKPAALIFHTADLHNRLPPSAARQLAQLKQNHPGALLLDAGDAVAAGNLAFRLGGEPILRQMAAIGYDAMAMGNRESHPTRRFLERKLRDASFPILAANLIPKRQPIPPVVHDHIVFNECNRLRLAVIGLAPQITPPRSPWARITDYVFEDPLPIAQDLATELRKSADLIVCLSHCGAETDHRLAALPDIDLVLGGHSHRHLISHEPGSALVAHPGRHGSHVARTELTCREDARSVLIPLEAGQ
ncbi:MAG: metallophosphoesterase [Armatimonadota bacterium]|nr:MAG: metallophosphoesterase [Armatimonadota bacterium]